jgi:hypothetical protein
MTSGSAILRWCDHSVRRPGHGRVHWPVRRPGANAGARAFAHDRARGFLLASGLNAQFVGNTLERVAGLDRTWGGSFHVNLGFKDRGRLLPSVRNLVDDVCREFVDSHDTISQLVTAVQELVENLVKYSEAGPAELDFELLVLDGQPMARIGTINLASPVHLAAAVRILERIVSATDPLELFRSLVATSDERKGSGLGLARLCAEAGLVLSYAVQQGQLRIEAKRTVQPRRSEA